MTWEDKYILMLQKVIAKICQHKNNIANNRWKEKQDELWQSHTLEKCVFYIKREEKSNQ